MTITHCAVEMDVDVTLADDGYTDISITIGYQDCTDLLEDQHDEIYREWCEEMGEEL